MRREASRELLAPRPEVWKFLSEPHHLPDWWPGVRGVQPDRRGFAPGARWQAMARDRRPLIGSREPKQPSTLVVGEIDPFERWTWRLTGELPLEVEVRLSAPSDDRTLVTVAVSASPLAGPGKIARTAVDRLYDLCQTAASP
ncbi:MAG TPA: SRPBCC family protein [Gaiellaceae bacterium]|jgi:uncharacterized protein YndB with AHSA1/START domain